MNVFLHRTSGPGTSSVFNNNTAKQYHVLVYFLLILMDYKNVEDLNVSWHRSQIGLVSQEPVLFSTAMQYVNFL